VRIWPRALGRNDLKLSQDNLSWGRIAMACTSKVCDEGVVFGGWCKAHHRYASAAVQKTVIAVLVVARRQQPAGLLHLLGKATVVEILEYLSLG
jgi:hypothetical protein